MADKKGVGHAYNVDFLNVVFAASSLFLFLAVVWMVWNDYDREWKNTQRRFAELQYQVTQAQLQQAERSVNRTKLQQLEAAQKAAEQKVAANRKKVDGLQAQAEGRDQRALSGDAAVPDGQGDLRPGPLRFRGRARLRRLRPRHERRSSSPTRSARSTRSTSRSKRRRPTWTAINKSLGQYTGEVTTLGKQIDDLTGEQTRLGKQLDVLAPSALKDYFRNAPLLDFMAPTLKIQQLILPDVVDDVNFIRIEKLDRCQTCHLAIDKKGYEKYPQPFTTHPDLALYLGGSSPHPDRPRRLHRLPRRHGAVGELPRRLAHADRREAEGRVGEEVRLGRAARVGLPDAADEDDGSVVREVPQAADLRPARRPAEPRHGHLRARGLLRVPQDQGLRGREEARADPDPHLLEADARLGEDVDPRSARRQADDVDAALLLQLEQQLARRRGQERSRDQRASSRICSPTPSRSSRPCRTRRSGDPKSGEQIVKSIGCQGCHVVGEGARDRGRAAAHLRPAAREHRQQDDLRVDLRLGAQPEALQPGHLHAEPAAHRPAGGRRRVVPGDAEGRRGRRGEGDAGPGGERRRPPRLHEERHAVRGSEGRDGEDVAARSGSSSSASARSRGTAASAATTSRASSTRSRSARTSRKRGASSSRGSTSRSSPTSRTRRSWRGSSRSCTIRGCSTRGAMLQPLDKLRMPNFGFSPMSRSSGSPPRS